MTIESKGYIATPNDITALTREILSATRAASAGTGTYLKALIGTTTQELGLEPRVHARKAGKLKAEEIAAHLAALEAVHTRFYEAVVAGASDNLPAKGRALELNRRTNFARSSVSTVRGYIRAGNDVTALVPARVVKAQLAVPARVRPLSPKRLKARAERQSKALIAALLALSQADLAAAATELELIMGQLTDQLGAITGTPTRNLAQAVAEHRPLRTKEGLVFMPTKTQVVSRSAVAAALRAQT